MLTASKEIQRYIPKTLSIPQNAILKMFCGPQEAEKNISRETQERVQKET